VGAGVRDLLPIKKGTTHMRSFKCPQCEGIFSGSAWNETTEQEYKEPITSIEDEDAEEAFFICPDCRALCEFHELVGEERDNA
jgi:uncharacterized C2H2 Zn-finger protein